MECKSLAEKGHLIRSYDGTVLKIDTEVNPKTSAEDMATTLGILGVAKR